MFVTAILLAAGKGKRLLSSQSKPLIKINGKPLIAYSLLALEKHPLIREIVIVANAGNREKIGSIIRSLKIKKVKYIVLGSLRRQDSLGCGLEALNEKTDIVLIHDAARPFISGRVISSAVRAAKTFGSCVVAVPVKATIKAVSAKAVRKTLDRSELWEIQTPQVFRKNIITESHRRFSKEDVTDDASLVEKLGKSVRIVEGSYYNIKVTTPEDVFLAGAIAKKYGT